MSGSTGSEHADRADRFADDPAFAVHEGGKLSVVPTRSIDSIGRLPRTESLPPSCTANAGSSANRSGVPLCTGPMVPGG